jgi:hypothetical protein
MRPTPKGAAHRVFCLLQNRAGFFFMLTLYISITSMSSLGWFITDRRLKWREWAASLYSAPALFVSTQTCDLVLLRMLPTLCIAVVTYPMIGLHATNAAFLTFVVILLLTAAIATTLNFIYRCVVFFLIAACASCPSSESLQLS